MPYLNTAIRRQLLPELLLLIAFCVFILWVHEFSYPASVLSGVVLLGCGLVFGLAYSNRKHDTVEMMLVAIYGIIIGSLGFCLLLTVGAGLLIAFKIINATHQTRVLLMAVTSITALAAYVGFSKATEHPAFCAASIQNALLMLMVGAVLCWQHWNMHQRYHQQLTKTNQQQHRLNTSVSIINKLARFIPAQIWHPIINDNSPVLVHNKRQQLTVLFSDIVGFTQLSDKLSADDLANILNDYMQSMTVIAKQHGATLDKFVGDGMVCFFGAPHTKGVQQDAIACLDMAMDMCRQMQLLCHQWQQKGFFGLSLRIGINTGYCHVGNFGSDSRMSYTAIGKEVNLAARLENAAPKESILISESTYELIKHVYDCEPQVRLQLKGFKNSINTYKAVVSEQKTQHAANWIDHDLSGFKLQVSLKDIKNYDHQIIRGYLKTVLKKIDQQANLLDDNQ